MLVKDKTNNIIAQSLIFLTIVPNKKTSNIAKHAVSILNLNSPLRISIKLFVVSACILIPKGAIGNVNCCTS